MITVGELGSEVFVFIGSGDCRDGMIMLSEP